MMAVHGLNQNQMESISSMYRRQGRAKMVKRRMRIVTKHVPIWKQQRTCLLITNSISNESGRSSNKAEEVVRSMYQHINAKDVSSAAELLDKNCIYEDLNFPTIFKGKEKVSELFQESVESCPEGLVFVIDECVGNDEACGMTWHVELDGKLFPNTRGASFYKVNESGKLYYARDIVENPLKLGSIAFGIISLVTPLARVALKDTVADEEEDMKMKFTGEGLLYIAFTILYVYILLLSPNGQLIPGQIISEVYLLREYQRCLPPHTFILCLYGPYFSV